MVSLVGSKSVIDKDGVAADADGEIRLGSQQTGKELDEVKEL